MQSNFKHLKLKISSKSYPKVQYQKKNKLDKESHYQMLKKLELSEEDHFDKNIVKKMLNYIYYDVEVQNF